MSSTKIYRTWVFHLAFMVLALLLPLRAVSQGDAGAISGTVKDSSGGVISGAKITLANEDTGQQLSTTSGSDGEYVFAPIKIGHYSLSVEIQGFRRVQHNNVSVDVQQKVVVDITLSPGATTKPVEDNAKQPPPQT